MIKALWQHIAGLLWGARASRRYDEAFLKTDEVVMQARELKRRLEPYTRERDPFSALMVDLYNRREEDAWKRGHQVNIR